jgi:hypothetical protein
VAASSVSFSSKNITLGLYVALIVLLLPREIATHRARIGSASRKRVPYDFVVPAH